MLTKELISDTVPSLKTTDTGSRALSWMDIFKVSHLPIVKEKEYLGLISDKDIYDLNRADEPVCNHGLSLISPFVTDSQPIYDAIGMISQLKLTILPVLNIEREYLGVITNTDIVHYFSTLVAADQPGGIIVLELNINDYSLSQIAQIVESNNVKILSLYVHSPKDSTKFEIIIKLNTLELTSVLQTFNRYDYDIKATFNKDDEMESIYSSRYEAFLRYLNV